ncbi:glutaredoxin-like protein NrdH [Bartonella sp. DGB2]|uniref:glutaredoxin-like protein NrdH n=1 Tax=Bartonella sp. DGB2 TaxID=3388426 RepID=UPI00398FD787
MITIYSKPNCVQCTATYRALDKHNIPYIVVDISENRDAQTLVENLGYRQVPVVFLDKDNHWAGFRPDKLAALSRPKE